MLIPALLGYHIDQGAGMTVEVITRRLEDRGGGLARINGQLRLIEGLALPREEIEFKLSYYNSATMWLDIDQVLTLFGLTRDDLDDDAKVALAVRTYGRPHAHLHHPEGCKKALGTGPGRHLPGDTVRKAVGRYVGIAGAGLPLCGCPPDARPAVEGSGATGWLAARWLGGLS